MYAHLMRELGWSVEGPVGSQIFYRSLGPIAIAKLQRPETVDLDWLKSFHRTHHTLTTYIEPKTNVNLPGFPVEPFAHSKTSLIDLSPSEKNILLSFSQKTRYNITHTLKQNELKIVTTPLAELSPEQLESFYSLNTLWSHQKHVVGYSNSHFQAVFTAFAGHGDLHLRYLGGGLVGALLILYHDRVATYYAALASAVGYQHFAPTLLTWIAIQTAKTRGCNTFDFGGIYDERYPKLYKGWQGFTKFKEGFHPTPLSYPPTKLQLFW
jgi:lipid II:glycine glycyltransferase (peptidoglycan interpeptide bridge formation enzyme)